MRKMQFPVCSALVAGLVNRCSLDKCYLSSVVYFPTPIGCLLLNSPTSGHDVAKRTAFL